MKKVILIAVLLICGAVNAQIALGASKFLGNLTVQGNVPTDFSEYWNQITPETECKWGSIESTRNVMNWTGCDRAYNYAKTNNIPFKFFTLIWGSSVSSWIMNLSQSDQLMEITEWMDAVQARYPDLQLIDVVNEGLTTHTPPPYRNALGGSGVTGYDWIITAFRMARERWPNAVLIYNDYNVIRWNTNEVLSLVKTIKQSGYVDAFGCQAYGIESLSAAQLKKTLDSIHEQIQLPIYISEYEVNISNENQQKTVMEAQFPVIWEADYVAGVTLRGYIVGATLSANAGLKTSAGVERSALIWLRSYVDSTISDDPVSVRIDKHLSVNHAKRRFVNLKGQKMEALQ